MNILCIGDSLTYGLLKNGSNSSFPYSQFINSANEGTSSFNIINAGVSGETTNQIKIRLCKYLKNKKYNYVIILAGTNDLGIGVPDNKIISNLQYMYDIVLKSNSKLIIMTIPENQFARYQSPKVNTFIRNNKECYAMYDLCKDIPSNSGYYSIDGIHFNKNGYKHIGLRINSIINL